VLPLADIIHLYSVAFCVVKAVHKFDVRLVISETHFFDRICIPTRPLSLLLRSSGKRDYFDVCTSQT
jgi:hypothetical protein